MTRSRQVPSIVDAGFYGRHGYPYDQWAGLRRQSPLLWVEGGSIKSFWAVTRQAEVQAVGQDSERFLSGPRIMADVDVRADRVMSWHLLNMDGSDHRNHRSLLATKFTARALPRTISRLAAIVEGQLDRLVGSGSTWEGDFATRIARPVPVQIVSDLLGLGAEDWSRLSRWSHELVSPADPEWQRGRSTEQTYLEGEKELFEWFAPRVHERRAAPGSDVLSHLANATLEGRPLTLREVLSYCQLFVTAGIDTTAAAISRSLLALSQFPDQYAWLRRNPDQVPNAVEELLRFTSPVVHFCRTASMDTEVGGQPVRRGQTLVLFYASANRDERVYENPDRLRLNRADAHHVAFGAGPHFCLGAPLARELLAEFLRGLVQRVQGIELAGPPEYSHSSVIGGLRRLPLVVEVDPRFQRRS